LPEEPKKKSPSGEEEEIPDEYYVKKIHRGLEQAR
jgi:hypothetical protein